MKLYLQTSQRRRVEIATVDTEEEANRLIEDLDDQFVEWEKAGFPEHPFPPVLANWEGSDIYLEGKGHRWMHTDFGWQEFFAYQDRDGDRDEADRR